MIGGGAGAFIGAVHRMAAALDGRVELVCGAFSRDAGRSLESGLKLGLPRARIYADYREMIASEAALPADERMHFVSIVTPNSEHFAAADLALGAGFDVFCEKPLTLTLDEARQLQRRVRETGRQLVVAHAYAAYPLVEEARRRIAAGELGTLRKVVVEYTQGWLAAPDVAGESRQAAWRLDPAQAGASCCMGDIGVHAAQLAEHVCGRPIEAVCADLDAVVPGRELDDDGSVFLRLRGGLRGVLLASQVCTGEENNLRLRIYGDRGGLEWQQQEPNSLWLKWAEAPAQCLRAATPALGPTAAGLARVPPGHPEGYLEAFANLYRGFAQSLSTPAGATPGEAEPWADLPLPGIDEAVRGMVFIEAVVASSEAGQQWRSLVPACGPSEQGEQ